MGQLATKRPRRATGSLAHCASIGDGRYEEKRQKGANPQARQGKARRGEARQRPPSVVSHHHACQVLRMAGRILRSKGVSKFGSELIGGQMNNLRSRSHFSAMNCFVYIILNKLFNSNESIS